jgi:hypothetical protein
MPMRSIVGDFPWETSINHCIVVGSPHIGPGQGLPGGVGTQVHSDVPSLRTVVISQSTTVAESAMYSGAARSASQSFLPLLVLYFQPWLLNSSTAMG